MIKLLSTDTKNSKATFEVICCASNLHAETLKFSVSNQWERGNGQRTTDYWQRTNNQDVNIQCFMRVSL